MLDCNPMNTSMESGVKLSKFKYKEKENPTLFKSLVGSLRYLTCTRPNILFVVGIVSYFMETSTITQMKVAKQILHHLKGISDYKLFHYSSKNFKLMGFYDSDFGKDINDRKNTIGFVFFISDKAISQCSKKQSIVTLLTCESDYVTATSCICHAIWLRRLLEEICLPQDRAIGIYIDNKSILAFANNPKFYDPSKHIDMRYHFIRKQVAKKEVELNFLNV